MGEGLRGRRRGETPPFLKITFPPCKVEDKRKFLRESAYLSSSSQKETVWWKWKSWWFWGICEEIDLIPPQTAAVRREKQMRGFRQREKYFSPFSMRKGIFCLFLMRNRKVVLEIVRLENWKYLFRLSDGILPWDYSLTIANSPSSCLASLHRNIII